MEKDFNRQRRPSFLHTPNILGVIGLVLGLFLVSPLSAQTKSGSYLAIVRWTHLNPNEHSNSTCIIVGLDGQYHTESTIEAKGPNKKKDKELQISTGFLPDEYFEQFKKLIEAQDLVEIGSPPRPAEMTISREMDAIVLSIHRTTGSQDVHFVDYDGKHPIPKYAADFVPWMKAVKGLDDMLIKDPESNLCHSLEPTADFLPQMIRR